MAPTDRDHRAAGRRRRTSIGWWLGALAAAAASLAFLIPADARAVGSAQAIAALNAQRAANGIPAGVREDASWSAKCALHTRYLTLNGGTLSHDEGTGKPGYTDDGAWAGANSVLSIGDWFADGVNPFESAPIHLMQTLAPQLAVTGAASSPHRWGELGCMITWPGYARTNPAGPSLLSYPGNGRTGVPADETAAEMPFVPGDYVGLPMGTVTGPHLYVFGWGTGRGAITSASLTGPRGPVAVRTVDNRTGEVGTYLPPGGIIIPVAPLDAHSTYTVTAAFTAKQALPSDTGFFSPSGPTVTVTRTWRFTTSGKPSSGVLDFDERGVGVESDNPAPVTVTITRRPSGTRVFSGLIAPGKRVAHHLPGGRYTACAHQDAHAQFEGFDECAPLTWRSTPKLTVKTARPRHGKVRLTVTADPLLAGVKATVTARGLRLVCPAPGFCAPRRTGKPVKRSIRLKARPVRVTVRLPRHGRKVELTVRASAPNAGELLLRAVTRTKTIRLRRT